MEQYEWANMVVRMQEMTTVHETTYGNLQDPIRDQHSWSNDLAFIIRKNMRPGDPKPPKFLVFFNSMAEAQARTEYLHACLSPELREKVKWFHLGMTDGYQEDEMNALLVGDALEHGVTDAAGMANKFIIVVMLLPNVIAFCPFFGDHGDIMTHPSQSGMPH
jgi:hypothetical protein